MSIEVPSEFFSSGSFGTLLGLTGVTYVVRNTLAGAFGFTKPWLALTIAIIATEIGVSLTAAPKWSDFAVGVLNGCLVFLTAGGSAQAIAGSSQLDILPQATGQGMYFKHRFLSSWF